MKQESPFVAWNRTIYSLGTPGFPCPTHPPVCKCLKTTLVSHMEKQLIFNSFIALYVQYIQLLLSSAALCLIWSSSASWMHIKVFLLQCYQHLINPGSPFVVLCVVTVLWNEKKKKQVFKRRCFMSPGTGMLWPLWKVSKRLIWLKPQLYKSNKPGLMYF